MAFNTASQVSHGVSLRHRLNNSISIVSLFQYFKYRSYDLIVWEFDLSNRESNNLVPSSSTKPGDMSILSKKRDDKV